MKRVKEKANKTPLAVRTTLDLESRGVSLVNTSPRVSTRNTPKVTESLNLSRWGEKQITTQRSSKLFQMPNSAREQKKVQFPNDLNMSSNIALKQ